MERMDSILQDLRGNATREDGAPAPGTRATSRPGPRRTQSPSGRVAVPLGSRRLRMLAGISGALALLVFVVFPLMERANVLQPAATAPDAPVPTTSQVATAQPTEPELTAVPQPTQWRAVIEELDRRRAAAIIARDAEALLQVDAPGSPALMRDRASIAALAAQELRVVGVPLRVHSVTERFVAQGPGTPTASLTVVDAMAAYAMVNASGVEVRRVVARPSTTWAVELRKVQGSGWRYVSAVRAVSATSP